MIEDPKAAFFDGIAEKWDGWEDLPVIGRKLRDGLEALGVGPDEYVLDVGCGTGNLTCALLGRLSGAGRIMAVDISPRMIEAARRKVSDPRVCWRLADARSLPLGNAECDRVICYSVWPHFADPAGVARELHRVLRPGGWVHVWHLLPRERVNQIHADAGDAVCRDVLPPAEDVAAMLAESGFQVSTAVETPESYLVTAGKASR